MVMKLFFMTTVEPTGKFSRCLKAKNANCITQRSIGSDFTKMPQPNLSSDCAPGTLCKKRRFLSCSTVRFIQKCDCDCSFDLAANVKAPDGFEESSTNNQQEGNKE